MAPIGFDRVLAGDAAALPHFERTLDFYRQLGFEISGGRKLKTTF